MDKFFSVPNNYCDLLLFVSSCVLLVSGSTVRRLIGNDGNKNYYYY